MWIYIIIVIVILIIIYTFILYNNFIKLNNDVKEAFTLMNKLKDKNTYVLLENDLPDIFNEK